MGRYDRPVKANLRFLATPDIQPKGELPGGIWPSSEPQIVMRMETLSGYVFLDEVDFHVYESNYTDDSGFIQDMKMIKISGRQYKVDSMILHKNSDNAYSFELTYGKTFYEAFFGNLQMNFVKFTFINKKLGWNKSFFLLMDFTPNARLRVHCTSDNYSSEEDYQNLQDVWNWLRNNEHEKIEVNLTFYRDRFLID